MMHRIVNLVWTTLLFGVPFCTLSAQTMGPDRIYQLSGLVVAKTNQEPVSFATIQVNRSRRGMLTSMDGFYSIPVVAGDTLWISCLGFKKIWFSVSDYLIEFEGEEESPYIYAIHYLPEDSILLDTVKIFPYDSPEKLKTAILAMGVRPDINELNARDNLDPRVLSTFIKNMDLDPGERILVGRTVYYQEHQTRLKAPVMPLFDPVAAYQLLRYINQKTKQKKGKDLNYWNED